MDRKNKVWGIITIYFFFIVFVFILYPIFAIIGGIILAILHIIFGGNGDLGTVLMDTSIFVWSHWKIILFILFLLSVFLESKSKEIIYEIKKGPLFSKLYATKAKKRIQRSY